MSTTVIVGTGHAGWSAATELRRSGFDGRIVMIGDEPYLPYERPPLSKSVMEGALPLLQPPDFYLRERIEVMTGTRVEGLDTRAGNISLENGTTLGYDALLLATGGRARPLNIPGGKHALTLRTFDDALRLHERLRRRPGHLTVIGAGVIGLEVAACARVQGWSVSVLEYDERPMARVLPEDMTSFIAEMHRQEGVDLRCRARVLALEQTAGKRLHVVHAEGGLTTDLVVAGVGMQPEIELAIRGRLETDGAIVVDDHGRTSAENVYAAGDAASFWHPRYARRMRMENWRHAENHAAAVARNMSGPGAPYDETPWSWSDQYGINIQIVGLPLDGDQLVLRGNLQSRKFVALHLKGRCLVGATLVNQGKEMRPCNTLIESRLALDLNQLQDPAIELRKLATGSVGFPVPV